MQCSFWQSVMALVDDQHGLWSNFYVGNYALALQDANGQNGFVIRAEFCEKNQYIVLPHWCFLSKFWFSKLCRIFQRCFEHDVFLIFHLNMIHIFRYIEKPDSRQTWSISRCSRSGFERQPRSSTHFHTRNNQFNHWQTSNFIATPLELGLAVAVLVQCLIPSSFFFFPFQFCIHICVVCCNWACRCGAICSQSDPRRLSRGNRVVSCGSIAWIDCSARPVRWFHFMKRVLYAVLFNLYWPLTIHCRVSVYYSPSLIFFLRFHLMWNRVDLAQRELDALRKLVGDEDNALVQRASCTWHLFFSSAWKEYICNNKTQWQMKA